MSSPHIRDLISRRALLKGAAATPLLTLAGGGVSLAASGATGPSFTAVRETMADTVTVPKECDWRVLASWGDPLFKDMAPFDPKTLTRAEQERRFGNNNDFVALFPAQYAFPWETDSDRLLMCVNHESSDVHLMYADLKTRRDTTPAQRQVALAAVGISVVEIERGRDGWRVRTGAPLNRRLTPFSPVLFAGPAAQHPWIETASAVVNRVEPPIADAPADSVRCGTLANCSGGRTPWGTYLSSEENLDGFYGLTDENAPLVAAARNDTALVYDAGRYGYPLYEKSNLPSAPAQFDMAHNPYGPSLYGWVVEVDPYDVNWTPRKRTALGRKKGECATTALTKDGRVAVYMGDDQVNHFVFKFVSRDQFNPADRKANRDLLDHGALYAARFDENGGGEWVELSVAACNRALQDAPYHARFKDQGDVLMRAREAAVLLGATPMDRPEDVEAPVDAQWRGQGVALVVCTMNRTEDYGRPGNPRRGEAETGHLQQMNVGGHILRIDEDGADNGATRFHWDVFALCGDPDADSKFTMPGGVAANVSVDVRGKPTMSGDRFVCPDNICFDGAGNVWIATDGLNEVFPSNDCVVVTPVNGAAPRPVKRFLVGPVGAEICGPALTPDERAFFCAIQHPGENDLKGTAVADLKTAGLGPGSHFPRGGASWPLSSIVIVSRKDGKKIWA